MHDISLYFDSDSLFALTDKIKAGVEGRMSWGDTYGIALGSKSNKHLIIWTPKETSESQILPGFDSKDGQLTLKMKHRPGAWVSWIDESKVQSSSIDDYDRVHKSIQELERNARQITDFADGMIANITIQQSGKPITLSDLTEDVLQARLILPNTIKTGGFVLTKTPETDKTTTKVIIPEQTHIQRVNLNEDLMLKTVEKEGYNTVCVVLRTHGKNYPDLLDLEYGLTVLNRFVDQNALSVRVLPTAAVYNPIEPKSLKFVPIEFTATPKEIEDAIVESAKTIQAYTVKANQHAYQLMTQFQQGVDSRLNALMLNRSHRIHNKVWDDLVIRELRNVMCTYCDFYVEYLDEHFEEDVSKKATESLKACIDPIIELWQLQDNQQNTLNYMIQSSYTLTNQLLDKASALFHDLVFEKDFISQGLVKPVKLNIYQDNLLLDDVYLPEWTCGTVREKLTRIALRSTLHPTQIERMRDVWLSFIEIANFSSKHNQDFEKVIHPLQNLLLAAKSSTAQRNSRSTRQTQTSFVGFEVGDKEFKELIADIKERFTIIKQWIENAPRESDTETKGQTYYATLWTLLLNGKYREQLLVDFQPTCDINLSVPDQTKRLMNLTLESKLVVENDKDRKTLERNLNRALLSKTGHTVRDMTSTEKLAIHGDITLSLLRDELLRYNGTLAKRVDRLSNTTGKKKSRNTSRSHYNGDLTVEMLLAEQSKVGEMIAFLKPYAESTVIDTLVHAGLNGNNTSLEAIRKQQVLSFELNELPSIDETWLTETKSLDDYPNLRMFLLQNKLPISTTGRHIMELRNILPDSLFNQVIGLIHEVKELQENSYEGEVLERFITYISEKVWRWELTQITSDELPIVVKEKVLTTAICYEKEVETLMEYVERYNELLDTKLKADSEMYVQREKLETSFQEIVETLI
ncbi:hypothetical protein F4X73_13520 [Candidatus Poribacteria bacterium]|nr:hypothetical protein [Candidatus Poribacteria bacterium]MYF54837.1 hypothetical protein [Candidatus Poribacteria bacterium]